MTLYTVRQGRRYRAQIELGWLEQIAGNEIVADRLREAGFTEVSVIGEGRTRAAEALWPLADTSAEIPAQVASIEEIEV